MLTDIYGKQFAEQLYNLRCIILHEGSFNPSVITIPRLIVVAKNPNLIMENCIIEANGSKVVIYDAPILCENIIKAVQIWENNNKDNAQIMENLKNIVHIHPDGIMPYFKGVPVIG